ncbi:MAG: VWA domain-containing protein, partial [Candidatus Nitrosopelagicus sp.]|nr:VWA domain-containing protein [Candidatus Nitrosopelagicus sp.]
MTRNTKILSERELFEKTKGIVEHAINAKINLTFRRGNNFCQYHPVSKHKSHELHEKKYTINIATPAVKGINKYTALLHELGHVLYKSPFTPIRKLLENSENHSLYFSIFNVLEDHRIESHLSENYIAYRQRFDKTCTALGEELVDQPTFDPLYVLLAIRFNQEEKVRDTKNFIHYKRALEDVKNTDEFGALRVLISIKKYVEEDLSLGTMGAAIQNKHLDKSALKDNSIPAVRSKHQKAMLETISKQEGVKEIEKQTKADKYRTKKPESSDSEERTIPKELLQESFDDTEIKKILEDGKIQGKQQFEEIQERMLSVGTVSENLPSNVNIVNREEAKYAIDYKVSSNLNKLFKKLKMKNKPYVDYQGYEIDIEEYVNNLIRGIDINKSFEDRKKSKGASIVISIDGSGSMHGRSIKIAQKLVATIYESLKGIPEIEVKGNIWSGNAMGDVGITEINNMNEVKNIAVGTLEGGYFSTPTHMGLEYSGLMLKKMKGEKKLLILITDGVPNHFKNKTNLQTIHYHKVCKKSL